MNYFGLKVYDMEEAIVASGFPKLKERVTPSEWEERIREVNEVLDSIEGFKEYFPKNSRNTNREIYNEINYKIMSNNSDLPLRGLQAVKRIINLGNCIPATGHDSALKSILVNVNITADQSFWLQWERYHHQDTVSSFSTMYCLTKFTNLESMFNEYVDKRALDLLKEKIEEYNKCPTEDNFNKVIYNCPEGIELTRRVTTNYLQLKTMYNQRKHHKMKSWNEDFINMCNELPFFTLFTNTTLK